jgi:hypothetical protein
MLFLSEKRLRDGIEALLFVIACGVGAILSQPSVRESRQR